MFPVSYISCLNIGKASKTFLSKKEFVASKCCIEKEYEDCFGTFENLAKLVRNSDYSKFHNSKETFKTAHQQGALVKIFIGMFVSFFGFEIYENVIFWVSLSCRHFFGVEKIAVISLGSLKICVILWFT